LPGIPSVSSNWVTCLESPIRGKIAFQIALNPPLSKGDFNSPLEKGGRGGDLHLSQVSGSGMRILKEWLANR
jgi:hypothetical protein